MTRAAIVIFIGAPRSVITNGQGEYPAPKRGRGGGGGGAGDRTPFGTRAAPFALEIPIGAVFPISRLWAARQFGAGTAHVDA